MLEACGYIPRGLGKSHELVRLVGQRVNNDACPEAAAVLSHAPRLGLVPALAGREFERARWETAFSILSRIQNRKVLTHDLRRRVTVCALGLGIPIGHISLAIEHDDRVLGNAFDQQPMLLFESILL